MKDILRRVDYHRKCHRNQLSPLTVMGSTEDKSHSCVVRSHDGSGSSSSTTSSVVRALNATTSYPESIPTLSEWAKIKMIGTENGVIRRKPRLSLRGLRSPFFIGGEIASTRRAGSLPEQCLFKFFPIVDASRARGPAVY
jgi:hypothetical protein